MKTLTRNEFLTLLKNNPGKKFVFQENQNNDTFDPDIQITSGNLEYPTFGAFYINTNEDDLLVEYDWDVRSDYIDADMFNVFDENDIREVINLLSSAIYSEKESEDKMSKEIINAKITNITISMSDHGCLTFSVFVSSNAIHCGIGGYCIGHGYLGAKDDVFDATDKGLVAMMRIMDTVGVERWEDLEGKYVRIEKPDWGESCTKIGNIIEDKWFDIKEYFAEAGGIGNET